MIQVSAQIAAMLVVAFLGCVFGFGKILLAQFETRIKERLASIKETGDANDAAVETLRADVAKQRQELLADFDTRMVERLESVKESAVRERESVAALRDQVHTLGQILPLEYVRREDWIRFSASIDHKQDRLAELVMEIKLEVTRARN